MGFKDMIVNAVNLGSESKFNVVVLPNGFDGEEGSVEMNYIQLGTYLVSNEQNIESVIISLKEVDIE